MYIIFCFRFCRDGFYLLLQINYCITDTYLTECVFYFVADSTEVATTATCGQTIPALQSSVCLTESTPSIIDAKSTVDPVDNSSNASCNPSATQSSTTDIGMSPNAESSGNVSNNAHGGMSGNPNVESSGNVPNNTNGGMSGTPDIESSGAVSNANSGVLLQSCNVSLPVGSSVTCTRITSPRSGLTITRTSQPNSEFSKRLPQKLQTSSNNSVISRLTFANGSRLANLPMETTITPVVNRSVNQSASRKQLGCRNPLVTNPISSPSVIGNSESQRSSNSKASSYANNLLSPKSLSFKSSVSISNVVSPVGKTNQNMMPNNIKAVGEQVLSENSNLVINNSNDLLKGFKQEERNIFSVDSTNNSDGVRTENTEVKCKRESVSPHNNLDPDFSNGNDCESKLSKNKQQISDNPEEMQPNDCLASEKNQQKDLSTIAQTDHQEEQQDDKEHDMMTNKLDSAFSEQCMPDEESNMADMQQGLPQNWDDSSVDEAGSATNKQTLSSEMQNMSDTQSPTNQSTADNPQSVSVNHQDPSSGTNENIPLNQQGYDPNQQCYPMSSQCFPMSQHGFPTANQHGFAPSQQRFMVNQQFHPSQQGMPLPNRFADQMSPNNVPNPMMMGTKNNFMLPQQYVQQVSKFKDERYKKHVINVTV